MPITFRDIFTPAQLGTFGTPLTSADIIVAILFSFATGLFIFYMYKKTFSGVLYSKNFNISLIMTTMIASVVMMTIGGNLALSLGMVGALSIIRFRTPVKDAKDLTFLFWSITAGIVNGVRFYKMAIISSIIIGAVMYVLSKKMTFTNPYVLILRHSGIDNKKLETVLKRHSDKFEMRSSSIDDSGISENTIEVKVKEHKLNALMSDIKEIKGVKKAVIFSHTGELSE